ncbi:unnamed protein product [Alopecurus aequalis]
MAAAEEGAPALMYQTVALKVSIHCEGCKKKVKRVLQSIEGVYKTDVDIQQHKVVVVGNVSVDKLVKKLVKTGKHAEPWPEPTPPPSAANSPGDGGGSSGKKKKKKKNKNKPAEPVPQGNATAEGSPPENHDNGGTCDEASGDEQPQKPEGGGNGGPHDGKACMVTPFVMTPNGVQPMAPPANVNAAGGGGKKKKKGKGGGNGNANANGDSAGATVETSPQNASTNPAAGNAVDAGAYPPAMAMSYPGYYTGGGHMPPPYAMSYSTAHPLRSSAYYHPMVGAAYTGSAGYFHSTAPVSAAPGSYYMFSEENANACSVM